MIPVVILDADDTLWGVEILSRQTLALTQFETNRRSIEGGEIIWH